MSVSQSSIGRADETWFLKLGTSLSGSNAAPRKKCILKDHLQVKQNVGLDNSTSTVCKMPNGFTKASGREMKEKLQNCQSFSYDGLEPFGNTIRRGDDCYLFSRRREERFQRSTLDLSWKVLITLEGQS
jgi:hypothetical protein